MNLIVVVFTFLMLLSILTVARIDSYLDFTEVRRLYHNYISEHERSLIHLKASQLYNSFNVKSESDSRRGNLTSLLDLRPLFLPPEEQDDYAYMTQQVAGNLIGVLCNDRQIGLQIVEALKNYMGQADHIPLNRTAALKEISFGGEEDPLERAWRNALNGLEGYQPLGKFISVTKKAKGKSFVSVYLARKELLQALFFDHPDLVERIMQMRQEIYRNSSKESEGQMAGEQQLKNLVGTHPYATYLDFRISKTKPPL